MKTAGIIAEYNPFHNGHAYQIQRTRELTGCNYVIVVMSGNFTQRGCPSITDKHTRAEMALLAGADLVLELPVLYACASAEIFALGGISLLHKLGVVDALSFGSECGEAEPLLQVAQLLLDESPEFKKELKTLLKSGYSYPKARALALISHGILPELIQTPNNILGIEYCKALLRLHSPIMPLTIKRIGSGFHETTLAAYSTNECSPLQPSPDKVYNFHPVSATAQAYSSASAIRKIGERLQAPEDVKKLEGHLPATSLSLLQDSFGRTFPISADDCSHLLHYKLLTDSVEHLVTYLDVSSDLADKYRNSLRSFDGFTSFSEKIKSKDLTQTRINRSLIHILLNIKKADLHLQMNGEIVHYARILGFRKHAAPLLNAIKKNTSVPLISKLSDARHFLSNDGMSMLNQDILAAHIYDSIVQQKFGTSFVTEYEKKLIIL